MSRAEQFLTQWWTHRSVLLKLVDAIPEGDENFTPWDGAMTIGRLAVHIVASSERFALAAATGEFQRFPAPEWATLADVQRIVDEWTQKTKTTILSISDADMDRKIDLKPVFEAPVKASTLLHSMRDHELHHKGQMYVYLRMCGVKELPFYVDVTARP